MAAPTEAYTGLSLYQNDCEHSIAKLDTDYDTMKLRFYLDEVVGTKEGVVGLVDPSGIKAQFHNLTTRQGKGRFGNYVALNDGGLHTKGNLAIGELSTDVNLGILVPISYKNAFYVQSDGIKLRYRINSDPTWIESFVKNASPEAEESSFVAGLNSISGGLVPNTLVYIEAQNINAEGVRTSAQQSITLPYPSSLMSYGSVASEAYTNYKADTSVAQRYFSTYGIEIGTLVYANSGGFINVSAGYYANSDFWIQVALTAGPDVKSQIIAAGQVPNWPSSDPQVPPTQVAFNFIHKEASSPMTRWTIGCNRVGTDDGFPTTAYRSSADNKFYQEIGLSTLVSDAYYYTGTNEFLIIVNGTQVGYGNCETGPIFPSEE